MKKCHNCGTVLTDSCVPCKINKITGFFCTINCYDLWNREYQGKYEGGLNLQ